MELDWDIVVIHIRPCHYFDVIIGMMASQITSLTIAYSTIYSDADQRKHQSYRPLCGEFTGDLWISAQMTSNAENVSISWRHHVAAVLYKLAHFIPFMSITVWPEPTTSQITGSPIVCLITCSHYQNYNSIKLNYSPFRKGIHWYPADSSHKWPVTRKLFLSQRASNAESIFMSWRDHETQQAKFI